MDNYFAHYRATNTSKRFAGVRNLLKKQAALRFTGMAKLSTCAIKPFIGGDDADHRAQVITLGFREVSMNHRDQYRRKRSGYDCAHNYAFMKMGC